MQITYTALYKGNFINVETPNFNELVKSASEVVSYVDYSDFNRTKKHPNEREYLVAKSIKSDVSVWQIQCTVRYNKKWSKDKIASLKKEAMRIVLRFKYVKESSINQIKRIAVESGISNLTIESKRLDSRDLNEKFKGI
jgi:hypothetical protein